jgi:small subunit ribosomal protein S7
MSRRRRAIKRQTVPDPIYNSVTIAKFVNKVMEGGKKSTAQRIVYNALTKFAEKVKTENVIEAFDKVLENAMPLLEVKTRRIGGANYQVPVEIPAGRRQAMAMVWIIGFSRSKPSRSMEEALASELTECFNMQGATIKKKEEVHRQAEANKAFAHFKF